MLLSLGVIFIVALIFAGILKKFSIPSLIGMLFAGIVLGPYALNLINNDILSISDELRKIALAIIIFRAGLSIDLKELGKVGNVTILLSFVPALLEIIAIATLAYFVFDFEGVSALLLGSVIAAVSPAVVVPRMLSLIENSNNKIAQMIMASASLEDVIVIIIFTISLNLAQLDSIKIFPLINMLFGILLGIVVGIFIGVVIAKIFKYFTIIDSAKVILLLAVSLVFIAVEKLFGVVYFSGLLAVLFLGITVHKKTPTSSKMLETRFKDLWVSAEIILFVLVGASLNIVSASQNIILAIIIIATGLIFRSIGVYISLRNTSFTKENKLFVNFAFIPKATVQAAIGGIAYSLGISNGMTILNISVIAILITAPIGALLIDRYKDKYVN